MGTPDFAVQSLREIVEAGYNVVAVVTMPDKPAGRGRQLQMSPVKVYALEKGLIVLQPEKLKAPEFIETLDEIKPDLGVVVAFRMLPEMVWNLPKLGTVNLHGSLLPQYRGAAPINWAIINGETETGYTIFQLQHQIDTGDVLAQEKMPISLEDNAGSIHDKMMVAGAKLLVKTINSIAEGTVKSIAQSKLPELTVLKPAPKIFRETCQLKPELNVSNAYNLIRGLSPYPAAWAKFSNQENEIREVKIFESSIQSEIKVENGKILSDNKSYIYIGFQDGTLSIDEIQPQGKRAMKVREYLAGNKFNDDWCLIS